MHHPFLYIAKRGGHGDVYKSNIKTIKRRKKMIGTSFLFSIERETEHRQFHILLPRQNREAEHSTCQTGFKGAEVGHTTWQLIEATFSPCWDRCGLFDCAPISDGGIKTTGFPVVWYYVLVLLSVRPSCVHIKSATAGVTFAHKHESLFRYDPI